MTASLIESFLITGPNVINILASYSFCNSIESVPTRDAVFNDLTSPILDAYILKKPVISLRVTDDGWGIPTAFKNNSCIVTDLEKFDDDLKNVLNNESVRNQLITDGEKSSKEYLAYQNNGSNKLITFLEELVN